MSRKKFNRFETIKTLIDSYITPDIISKYEVGNFPYNNVKNLQTRFIWDMFCHSGAAEAEANIYYKEYRKNHGGKNRVKDSDIHEMLLSICPTITKRY